MTEYLWRSMLYTPGHLQKFAFKAASGEADVVVIDLEDSVPSEGKGVARDLLAISAAALHAAGKEVAVRINGSADFQKSDLEAAVRGGADIIVVPKVTDGSRIHTLADHLQGLEGPEGPPTKIIALIETPVGLLNATEIARCHPRLKAINLGTEDFAFEMGMEPEWDSLLYASQQIVVAARAAGIIPLGYAGSIAQFRNIDAFDEVVRRSARLGFEGGFAIHPVQVSGLNRAFSPNPAEIDRSQRIVEAFAAAKESGAGAVSVDGRMVDLPVARRAEQTLFRAQLIGARNGGDNHPSL